MMKQLPGGMRGEQWLFFNLSLSKAFNTLSQHLCRQTQEMWSRYEWKVRWIENWLIPESRCQ